MNDKNYIKINQMILEFGTYSELNQCFDEGYSELILCNLISMGVDMNIVDEKVKPLLQEYADLCIQHGKLHDYEQIYKDEEEKYNEICDVISKL